MSLVAAAELPTLHFRLPGRWWQLDLLDPDAARASVRRVVDARVGSADRLATLRRELRAQLLSLVETALEGGGLSMHIALDIVDDVPLSASFTVFLPGVGMTPTVGTESGAVLDVLERGIRSSAPEEVATIVRFSAADTAVLRTHRRRELQMAGADVLAPVLAADYWLAVPGTKRVMLLAFSTGFAELEEVMLTLFDSIVHAAYWTADTEDAAPVR